MSYQTRKPLDYPGVLETRPPGFAVRSPELLGLLPGGSPALHSSPAFRQPRGGTKFRAVLSCSAESRFWLRPCYWMGIVTPQLVGSGRDSRPNPQEDSASVPCVCAR